VKLNDYSAYSEKMIKEAIDCYVNKDLALAIDILKKSNIIHDVGQKIFNDILSEMQNDPKIIVGATNLVLILRHIERLKDHATNIAEDVVFMIEGKIVKHSRISENLEDGLIQ
jgi:phosphate transport system protein